FTWICSHPCRYFSSTSRQRVKLPETLRFFITTGAVRQLGLTTVRNAPMVWVAQPVSVNSKHSAKTNVKFISQLPNVLHKSSDADLTSPQFGLCIQRTKGVAGHPHPDTISRC